MSNTPHLEGQQHHDEKTYTIIVNGEQKTVTSDLLTYTEIVALAFPDMVSNPDTTITVTFRKAEKSHHEGTLVNGQTVKIIDGTVFDVTATNKS